VQYVIGSVLALATVALVVGAITGRVKVQSCCAPADPACDRRMRAEVGGEVSGFGLRDPAVATPEQNSHVMVSGGDV